VVRGTFAIAANGCAQIGRGIRAGAISATELERRVLALERKFSYGIRVDGFVRESHGS
jgi:hypothetical protein